MTDLASIWFNYNLILHLLGGEAWLGGQSRSADSQYHGWLGCAIETLMLIAMCDCGISVTSQTDQVCNRRVSAVRFGNASSDEAYIVIIFSHLVTRWRIYAQDPWRLD